MKNLIKEVNIFSIYQTQVSISLIFLIRPSILYLRRNNRIITPFFIYLFFLVPTVPMVNDLNSIIGVFYGLILFLIKVYFTRVLSESRIRGFILKICRHRSILYLFHFWFYFKSKLSNFYVRSLFYRGVYKDKSPRFLYTFSISMTQYH